jgi:hypothetical protein
VEDGRREIAWDKRGEGDIGVTRREREREREREGERVECLLETVGGQEPGEAGADDGDARGRR